MASKGGQSGKRQLTEEERKQRAGGKIESIRLGKVTSSLL